MKRFAVILVIIGLSLIPSVTLAEYHDLPVQVDTETITNEIPDTTGTYEPPLETSVSDSKPSLTPIVEETMSISCTCDLDGIRIDIQELYNRDELRHEQIYENYDYLVDAIEDLRGQIYELQNTTSY